jgi:hypothetical protein
MNSYKRIYFYGFLISISWFYFHYQFEIKPTYIGISMVFSSIITIIYILATNLKNS